MDEMDSEQTLTGIIAQMATTSAIKRGEMEKSLTESPPAVRSKKVKIDKIDPIIIFKISETYLKNKNLLHSVINKAFTEKIGIDELKLTANGNLMIYPSSKGDKYRIINNNKLFPNCRKLDIGIEKKYQLILKGISADDLSSDSKFLDSTGIKNVIPITKDNIQLRLCKIEVESQDIMDRYLNKGYVVINLFKYKVEQIAKPPPRCNKCKRFDHLTSNCNFTSTCGKCGSTDHSDETCSESERKCVNCGQNHSSYYRGCASYKELYKDILNKNKINFIKQSSANGAPSGFYRNYSTALNNNDEINQSDEVKKLSSQINLLQENINSIKNEIISFKEIAEDLKTNIGKKIEEKIFENNNKLIYFFTESFKILVNPKKISNAQLENIMRSFTNLQLGKGCSITEIASYLDKSD